MKEIKFKTGLILSINRPFKWYNIFSYTSLLIRLGNKSKWSHTAITLKLHDNFYVIDSDFNINRNGVQIIPWNDWVKRVNEINIFDPKVQPEKFNEKLLSYPGKIKYDLKGLLGHVFKVFNGSLSGKRETIMTENSADICSEFVAKAYQLDKSARYSPQKFYSLRFKNFSSGVDLYEGKSNNFKFK